MLANRLKQAISFVLKNNQEWFIKSRQAADIRLVVDLIDLHENMSFVSLSLDTEKAYDNIYKQFAALNRFKVCCIKQV